MNLISIFLLSRLFPDFSCALALSFSWPLALALLSASSAPASPPVLLCPPVAAPATAPASTPAPPLLLATLPGSSFVSAGSCLGIVDTGLGFCVSIYASRFILAFLEFSYFFSFICVLILNHFHFLLSFSLVLFRFFHFFLFHHLSFHLISDHLILDHLISQ